MNLNKKNATAALSYSNNEFTEQCYINWHTPYSSEWIDTYNNLRRANLLQSPDYAIAAHSLYAQKARHGFIYIGDQQAGIVQILQAGHPLFLQATLLDRGPLWFEGFGSKEHIKAFFLAFDKECPKGVLKKRRILPEVIYNDENHKILQSLEYKFKYKNSKLTNHAINTVNSNTSNTTNTANTTYQTIWIDLQLNEEALRKNLNSNWKRSLKKAQKANMNIEWDLEGQYYSWFLKGYKIDQLRRPYPGASIKVLDALRKVFEPQKKLIIGRAILDNKAVASILLLRHGKSATYQIGWSLSEGKENGAHHLLLWDSLRLLKEMGVYDLDLGGVNDGSAKGIKQFKQGMGGEFIELLGHCT